MKPPQKSPLSEFQNLSINVSLVTDREIQVLNRKYLKKDQATDVLSFNINQTLEDGTYYLGDVIVNKNQAEKQASDFGNTFEQEISELVAHGVLHLLGIHHKGDNH